MESSLTFAVRSAVRQDIKQAESGLQGAPVRFGARGARGARGALVLSVQLVGRMSLRA